MTTSTIIEPPRADFAAIDPGAASLLAERWARRFNVVPLFSSGGTITAATADPLDLDAECAVAFATGLRVAWRLADRAEIEEQLDRLYSDVAPRRDTSAPPVEVQHLGFSSESVAESLSSASVIPLVDALIAEAIGAGASDLHLEPEEQGIAVRHRIDGVLRQVRVLPRGIGASLVSRVKILSSLDIADRMRPQDGRARVAVHGSVVDLRVSTLPVSHGEKIVVRVLDGSAGLRTLESIGFADEELARIRGLLQQREGLVLVTGPTGSGKTTTLYAALREVQERGVNVVTVEDPIEYRLPGIVQVQVHEKAGLTFSAALRSIMRQDPDVILVGEIRDRETAEIAIQASLTGHLVLSTLHTNDAASAVTRLIDIGVQGYQIATAVKGVVAQRLVRRTCPECAGSGCATCDRSGYRGRRAIAEILVSTPDIAHRITSGASTESIADAARSSGSRSLWDSGIALVRAGETTMDELRRIAAEPSRQVREPRRRSSAPSADITILWLTDNLPTMHELLRDVETAAIGTRHRVLVIPLSVDEFQLETLPVCDAIVCPADSAAAARRAIAAAPYVPPLLIGLLPSSEAVFAGEADLQLSVRDGGAKLLTSLLALLRWRAA